MVAAVMIVPKVDPEFEEESREGDEKEWMEEELVLSLQVQEELL